MDAELPIPDRLKAGSPGLGEASEAEIEQRAIELATADGRDAFTDADLARAAAELAGGAPDTLVPEADAPIVEELESWDEPVELHGFFRQPVRGIHLPGAIRFISQERVLKMGEGLAGAGAGEVGIGL